MSKRNAKKKDTRRLQRAVLTGHFEALHGPFAAEAIASVSLDGETRSCDACQREHVTVRLDGKRLDEVVGYGRFHLEDNGGCWFLELGNLTMNLTSRKAVPIDAMKFEAGTVFEPEKKHTCGQRPMTADERMLVDEIVRACEIDASRHTPYVQGLASRIRAERKEGR